LALRHILSLLIRWRLLIRVWWSLNCQRWIAWLLCMLALQQLSCSLQDYAKSAISDRWLRWGAERRWEITEFCRDNLSNMWDGWTELFASRMWCQKLNMKWSDVSVIQKSWWLTLAMRKWKKSKLILLSVRGGATDVIEYTHHSNRMSLPCRLLVPTRTKSSCSFCRRSQL
jgi:hypothetical protein